VVKGSGNIWAAVAQMSGPILQGGRLSSSYEATVAQREQAKLQYQQSVITALQEVSNALVNQQKLAEVQRELALAVSVLEESVRLSTLRYTGGLAVYLK
jgi:outer membrane protein TolC